MFVPPADPHRAKVQVGKTYVRRPIPTWPKERKGIVVRISDDDYLVEMRDPRTGLHFTERTADLEGPIESIPPPAVCPTCRNSREIARWALVEDEPWAKVQDGLERCPYCTDEPARDHIAELREVAPRPNVDFTG